MTPEQARAREKAHEILGLYAESDGDGCYLNHGRDGQIQCDRLTAFIHSSEVRIEAMLHGQVAKVAPGLLREQLGKLVRNTWVKWAASQPSPKPSWLLPWEQLSEADREVDRLIGEAVLATVSYSCPGCGKTFYTETPNADAIGWGSQAKFELPELCRRCDTAEQFKEKSQACEAARARIATLERERDGARTMLARAADHLESAADIIAEDCPGSDEDDDADEREFIAELRALAASTPPSAALAETAPKEKDGRSASMESIGRVVVALSRAQPAVKFATPDDYYRAVDAVASYLDEQNRDKRPPAAVPGEPGSGQP